MIRIDDVHSINLVMKAAQVHFVPYLHHCISLYNSTDRLMAGVLFTDWNQGSVLMHFAVFPPTGGLGKDLLWLAFHYPFEQLKVKKVFGLVPEWNIPARNLDLKLGFKIEYKIDDVFNHKHLDNGMYIMSMKREDCRWLKMKEPKIHFARPEQTNILKPIATMEGLTLH
jgi:hypothetical protein